MKRLIIPAIVIVIIVALGIWYFDTANKQRAVTTAQEFVNHLRMGEFDKAYNLTSPGLKKEILSAAEFEEQLKSRIRDNLKFTNNTPKVTSSTFTKSMSNLSGEITFTFAGSCIYIVETSPIYDDGKFHYLHGWQIHSFDDWALIDGRCK